MSKKNKANISIELGEKEADGVNQLFDEWKRYVNFIYGYGSIKKRIIQLLKEDLEKLKKERPK